MTDSPTPGQIEQAELETKVAELEARHAAMTASINDKTATITAIEAAI